MSGLPTAIAINPGQTAVSSGIASNCGKDLALIAGKLYAIAMVLEETMASGCTATKIGN